MRLDIRGPSLLVNATLHQFVARRLRYALSRFQDQIEEVTVRLSDEKGLKGESDKICHVVVKVSTRSLSVTDAHTDLHEAVSRAAERMGRAVCRELERNRVLRLQESVTQTRRRKRKSGQPIQEEEA